MIGSDSFDRLFRGKDLSGWAFDLESLSEDTLDTFPWWRPLIAEFARAWPGKVFRADREGKVSKICEQFRFSEEDVLDETKLVESGIVGIVTFCPSREGIRPEGFRGKVVCSFGGSRIEDWRSQANAVVSDGVDTLVTDLLPDELDMSFDSKDELQMLKGLMVFVPPCIDFKCVTKCESEYVFVSSQLETSGDFGLLVDGDQEWQNVSIGDFVESAPLKGARLCVMESALPQEQYLVKLICGYAGCVYGSTIAGSMSPARLLVIDGNICDREWAPFDELPGRRFSYLRQRLSHCRGAGEVLNTDLVGRFYTRCCATLADAISSNDIDGLDVFNGLYNCGRSLWRYESHREHRFYSSIPYAWAKNPLSGYVAWNLLGEDVFMKLANNGGDNMRSAFARCHLVYAFYFLKSGSRSEILAESIISGFVRPDDLDRCCIHITDSKKMIANSVALVLFSIAERLSSSARESWLKKALEYNGSTGGQCGEGGDGALLRIKCLALLGKFDEVERELSNLPSLKLGTEGGLTFAARCALRPYHEALVNEAERTKCAVAIESAQSWLHLEIERKSASVSTYSILMRLLALKGDSDGLNDLMEADDGSAFYRNPLRFDQGRFQYWLGGDGRDISRLGLPVVDAGDPPIGSLMFFLVSRLLIGQERLVFEHLKIRLDHGFQQDLELSPARTAANTFAYAALIFAILGRNDMASEQLGAACRFFPQYKYYEERIKAVGVAQMIEGSLQMETVETLNHALRGVAAHFLDSDCRL